MLNPDLSIVIVSYNTQAMLRDCLESLAAGCGDLSYEVFVVDNGSHDHSPAMVREKFPQVRLLANNDNRGFAAANNQALRQATGNYVLLLNSDTVLEAGSLEQLVHFMNHHPQVGYCGPELLNGDGTHQSSARRFPTPLSGFLAGCGWSSRHPVSRHCLDLHLLCGTHRPFRADALSGACLMIRHAALRQVGLLDEGYFMYFEETQLCHRLTRAGFQGWYCPLGRVKHWGGQSVGTAAAGQPFGGDHPYYWIKSRRRYMRFAYGWLGMLTAEWLDITLHMAVIGKNAWRRDATQRQKAIRSLNRLGWIFKTCVTNSRRHTAKKTENTFAFVPSRRKRTNEYQGNWADST